MTVSSTANREQYATNGVTAAFTIHFPFFEDTDVNAIFVDALGNAAALSLNADFTVTGGHGEGGTLICSLPPADDGTLTIFREIPFTQEDDYVEDDPLPADTLEGGFDRGVMRDQQLLDAQDRALTFPVTVAPDVSGELPNPIAGEFLRFSEDGKSIVSSPLANLGAVGQATETVAGIGELATDAEMIAGTAGKLVDAAKVKISVDAKVAANTPIGRHAIPISTASMVADQTNGPAAAMGNMGANKVVFRGYDFDKDTAEYLDFWIAMPPSWDGGNITFRPIWTNAATAGTGDVSWALNGLSVADDESINQSFTATNPVVDTFTTSNDLLIGAESAAISVVGTPAGGEVVFFRMFRNAAAASDTYTQDARLIGVVIYITLNAAKDA